MATAIWKGDAAAIAQVSQWTFAGTWGTSDTFSFTIGSKTISITTGSATISTICTTAATALAASTIPEFLEVTWTSTSSTVVGTAVTAGKPFTCTADVTSSASGTIEGVAAGGSSTIAPTTTTTSSGPNDVSLAANWNRGGSAAVPQSGDDIVCENTDSPMMYNLSNYSGTTFASFTVADSVGSSFYIGLPRTNTSSGTGYVEYRTTYWTSGITTINLLGGQNRLKFALGAVQTTCNVLNVGVSAEYGIPTVQLTGTHASNVVNVSKGSVGVAFFTGETSTVATTRIGYKTSINSDSEVYLGSGCTLTTINKSGGVLYVDASFTTLNHNAGEAYVRKAAAPTTLNIFGGTVYDMTSGTTTTANIYNGGTYDLSQDSRAKTITNTVQMYDGSSFLDPQERASSVVLGINGDLASMTINLGEGYTLTRS